MRCPRSSHSVNMLWPVPPARRVANTVAQRGWAVRTSNAPFRTDVAVVARVLAGAIAANPRGERSTQQAQPQYRRWSRP
jgi:hypothetical protein